MSIEVQPPLFLELTHAGRPVAVNITRIGWFLDHAGASGAVIRIAGIEGGLDVEESYAEIGAKLDAVLQPPYLLDHGSGAVELSAYAASSRDAPGDAPRICR